MNLETNKALFLSVLLFFSTAIVFLGAYDLKKRYGRFGGSEVSGYKMVEALYGEVDLEERAAERRRARARAIRDRNESWEGFKRFFASFIP